MGHVSETAEEKLIFEREFSGSLSGYEGSYVVVDEDNVIAAGDSMQALRGWAPLEQREDIFHVRSIDGKLRLIGRIAGTPDVSADAERQ